MKKHILLLLAIFISLNVFAQEFNGKQKDIQQILKNIDSFSQHYMNGEAQKMVDAYTTDGKIFPNRRDIMGGQKDLLQYWTLPEGVKILHHKITPVEITVVKKTAYDYGYYEGETQRPDGTTVSWKGKYVIVWKKVGKDWKMYLDIWNSVDG